MINLIAIDLQLYKRKM